MSDVFSDISYIPLEAKEGSFVERIDHLVVDDDFILVHDRKHKKLLQFNAQGKFVKEFMKFGRGPGEFFEITAVDFNDKKEVLVLRNGQFVDIIDREGGVLKKGLKRSEDELGTGKRTYMNVRKHGNDLLVSFE